MPNDLCDLDGFDTTSGNSGVSDSLTITDFSQDRTINWMIYDRQLNTMYQMTDAYKYISDVLQYKTSTAHVLVGDPADAVTSVYNTDRAFTHCLHLRNDNALQLQHQIDDYVDQLGYAITIDVTAFLSANFGNTDIVLPDNSADGTHGNGGREVGTHEFGHYAFCNMMLDGNDSAVDGLFGSTVRVGQDYDRPTRYINEAFADFISGQVASIANYKWLDIRQEQNQQQVCVAPNGFDNNFVDIPSSSNDKAGIARIATLFHDAVDGREARGWGPAVPGSADAWIKDTSSQKYEYTYTGYANVDGENQAPNTLPQCRRGTGPGFSNSCVGSESVALAGSAIPSVVSTIAHFGGDGRNSGLDYLKDENVYLALDATMTAAGYTWCQRCALFALHAPANAGDNLGPLALLQQCAGSNSTTQDDFLRIHQLPYDPPPDLDLRLDLSTCSPCPDGQVSDANGVCRPCDGVIEGNTCVQCPSNVVLDGNAIKVGASFSWDTTQNRPAKDVCPNWFWVEIDNPQAILALAPSMSAGLSVTSPSQASCAIPFTASFEDFPAGGIGFQTEQSAIQVGSLSSNGQCSNLPTITIYQSSLSYDGSPVRFGANACTGVVLDLDVGENTY